MKSNGNKGSGGVRKRENINKMRDLLSKAKQNTSSLFTDVGSTKRLEFSSGSLCVYDKHKILINDIFLNENINTFISYNDKSLHSWNPETMELISHINFNDAESGNAIQSISCLCYSSHYHLYFACSKDFKLIVFNEHLNLVYWQRMPVGLVQSINFHETNGNP
jgi:WD40 repeat protein